MVWTPERRSRTNREKALEHITSPRGQLQPVLMDWLRVLHGDDDNLDAALAEALRDDRGLGGDLWERLNDLCRVMARVYGPSILARAREMSAAVRAHHEFAESQLR